MHKLLAPHAATMAAILALGTGAQPDLVAQKALTGTLRSSKLAGDHTAEVVAGLEQRKKVLEGNATHTGYTREMLADLNETIGVVRANFANTRNGHGKHDERRHDKTSRHVDQARQMQAGAADDRQRT